VGKDGTPLPAHIVSEVPKVNVGVMFGVTVTVKVAGLAHWAPEGVNVYVLVFWLSTTAGLQLPAIPLDEVDGKDGILAPAQIERAVPKLNVGVVLGFTVTLMFTGTPHWFASGVNV
jgi:hypothetical protein